MPLPLFFTQNRVSILLLTVMGLVYCQFQTTVACAQANPKEIPSPARSAAKSTKTVQQKIHYDFTQLPLPVQEMRNHILSASKSGRIEDLRLAIEWNEISPVFASDRNEDPIAYFKALSADAEGVEILAILANILNSGYVTQPLGPDVENNLVYIWPYFAETPLKQLSSAHKVELARILPIQSYKQMMTAGAYTGYHVSIGADGTWHEFTRAK